MNKKPDFWKVRLDEIETVVNSVKKGQLSTIATSPAKHPVYAVSYGPAAPAGTTNWSGAMGAGTPAPYKDELHVPQSVILVGACHGAEMEATAGLNNFIWIMETGKDFAGNDRTALKSLGEKYRLVIIPCLNPDGRANSPDHMIGIDAKAAVRINQGIWKDGTSVGYPACKMYQPLPPDKVQSLGGYPNSAGYNIMHDATPGDIRTDEARCLLKLTADEKADLVLHMHSHGTAPRILPPDHGMLDLQRKRVLAYRRRMADFFQARHLDVEVPKTPDPGNTWLCPVNLATMTALASGALSPIYEQPNGSCGYAVTCETMLEHSLAAVELFLEWGRKERFSPRLELMYTMLDSSAEPAVYYKEKWE
jgi:hypothetical protein